LKKEQVLLLSETVREKDIFQLLCRLSRLRQKRLLCMIAFWHFQWIKGLKTASFCFASLFVAIMKDQVQSSFEE